MKIEDIAWTGIDQSTASNKYELLKGNGFKFSELSYEYLRTHFYGKLSPLVTEDLGDKYKIDLAVGMALYSMLPAESFGLRHAADDGVWRHLSIDVIPDIVFRRWGDNPDRFWRESRRLWLKTLWWYIHLSWQGDELATLKILNGRTTDTVVQLVERSGREGYRVELYRSIMKLTGDEIKGDAIKRDIFRPLMKLNTARLAVVEPMFCQGGIDGYVKSLLGYFNAQEHAAVCH